MKVLYLTRESDLPETHLMIGLQAAGFEGSVMGSLLPALEAKVRQAGLLTELLEIRSRLDAAAVRRVRQRIREWRPDIVQCFTSRALTCALASRLPADVCLVAYRGAIGRLSRFDPANVFGVFHRRVDGILCLSDSIVEALAARGVPRSKLFKIHKGHEPSWYPAEPSERRRDPSEFVIGFIGNMRRVKGAHVLLEAARHLDSRLKYRLVLIGEILDPLARELIRSPEHAGRIEAPGFVPDAFRRIREFDVLVVPSLEGEGLSKAAIEAMAQRVPVVASASGGLVELVEDGVSGRLVPPGNPNELARVLMDLAGDPAARERLAEAAYARITREYHISRTVQQVAEIYRLLRSARPARKSSRGILPS
ncbi:MAG: glycosyltransferase family 4 protein [Kiritimatiellae bacterium]|nr:glycosyltransferase family 4 protein [Kiritimatiellia bacterium]MDW8459197.1 glycosyltransferase family 4 protein [Verrucomicrobiota bacterium]